MADASDRRPAPSATGTLAERPLSNVLLYARNKRLTGKFEIHAPDGRHGSISFWRGRITDAKTVPPTSYLGAILYELGWIDAATLDATLLELAKKQKKHGEILVERGAITAAQRDDALTEQVCRKIHHLFGLPGTTGFAFYDARAGVEEPLLLVDPLAPAWRGIRDYPPTSSIAEVAKRFLSSPLRLVNEAPLDRAGFSPEEAAIVRALCERPMTVGEMRSMSKLPIGRVDQLAFLLVAGKCAEAATPSQQNLPAAAPSEPRIPLAHGGGAGMRFPTPFHAVQPMKTPSSASMPAAPARSMSSGEVRAQPPSFRVLPAAKVTAAPTSSPKLEAANVIPIGPADLGPTGLAARAQRIEAEGYFEALGLPSGASEEAVRAAYFRLAKLWHPDRLPADLAPYRDEVSAIFSYLTRAHGTLTDPDARKAYLATGATVETRPRAQVIREIEGLIAKNDWASAHVEAQALRDASPEDADAVALLAWTTTQGGEAPEDTLHAAITQLDRAVYGDRYCERAYWYRGLLQKKLGNAQAAHRDFTRVVQLAPKHVDAQREIRIHEMRQRKGSGEHLLTLFGKHKKG